MLRNKLHVYGDDKVDVPAHLNFGKDMLDTMITHKDVVALINSDAGEKITYGELAQQTVDIALSLTRIGVRRGDVISITLCREKKFEVMATMLGIMCAGATFSPADITYQKSPLLHRVKIAKPRIMFCTRAAFDAHKETLDSAGCIETYILYGEEHRRGAKLFSEFLTETARVEDFLPTPVDGWADILIIIFSSGTTGLPKGVPITHLNFLVNTKCLTDETFVAKPILNTREWYYAYGLLNTLTSMRGGATIVYSIRNQLVDNLEAIQKYQIKYLQLSPSTVMELIKSAVVEKYDVTSVEHILSSSTAATAEMADAIKLRFPNLLEVLQAYGMSEAGNVCTSANVPQGSKPGSVGLPNPGFIMKVVDLTTRAPLGPNQRGEICLKSISLMKGYLCNNSTDYMDVEGFYKTGDVGYYDEDNCFYIVDRVKELIKFNDLSIAPAEFESILLQHPAVIEAGVVGAPHSQYGEAPTAFVVLQPGATVSGEELVAHLESYGKFRMRLVGGVRFVEKLPRGAGEKLDRSALKLML